MVVVADASVAIRGDLQPFMRDLRGAERATGGLGDKLRSIFSPRNVLAGAGLFGIGLGVRQLVGFAGDAAKAFSDLQQTTRTVDAVFGASAGVIHEWGETAADAAGLSKREVNEAASVMGQTLLNMGFAADEAAAKTVQLQQRAADLALAFGKDPQDAILAITAAMRGERDTIEKFGVSIKQADVNSRVLALGLDTSTTASKKNSEAVAILDIILEQSASSAGRFADSQDDVAVKLEQNQAKIDNFMATLGEGVSIFQLEFIRMVDDTGAEIDKFSLNFGDRVQTIIRLADDAGVSFDEMKQRIITDMTDTGQGFDQVVDGIEVELAGMTSTAEAEFMASARAAGNGVAAMRDELALGGPVIAQEAGKIAGMLPSEIRRRIEDIRQVGRDSVLALAEAILEKQRDPLLAVEALNNVIKEELSQGELIAALSGAETVASLKTALNSDKPGTRTAAREALQPIQDTLNSLGPAGRAAAAALMRELAAGIDANSYTPTEAMRRAVGGIRAQIPFSEPKDPLSPLRGITKWNPIAPMIDNLAASGPQFAAATRQALGGIGMPSTGGGFGVGAASAAGGIHVHVHSVVPPTSEIQLREIGERVGPAIEQYLVHRGRMPRRGSEGGL